MFLAESLMPTANWDVCRVGAYLPSVDSLVDSAARDQVRRLQGALSSVVCIESAAPTDASSPASDDPRFIGRLLLGLCSRGWPTVSSPDVELALLESIDPSSELQFREHGPTGSIGWRLDAIGAASE